MRMREILNAAAAVLCEASAAYGHGGRPGHIDEGPGPATWITIIMVVSWIVIALAVVFFVLRLIRQGGSEERGKVKQEKEAGDNDL
jgi:hypothetical protein